ncbi:MAG TPA: hypothetical protein PL051_01005 [Candidatus Saccharibacteria bacterium]|nr:hypothetical protein [Candidatus Saccharibacteria bacterium]HRJ90596.1 hypothetical protein [Candidatus Saccharibacteria bacterium]
MNKSVILLLAGVFGTVGAYIPVLFGDNDFLSGWSILGSMLGGFFGIWLAVWIGKRIG